MTPDRLRECLALLQWSQRGLAGALGRDERQVRRWATGRYEVPPETAAWLERRARAMQTDPPPIAE
jgi:plasmid maintenance system antidote protein VapI